MNELQTENEKPLLVVKYVWWRVLWRIFFPLSIGCFIGFLGGTKLIESGHYLVGIFFYLISLIAVYAILELLMTKKFVFYPDKIVKVRSLFGSKEMKYIGSTLGVSSKTFSPLYSLSGYSFYRKVFFKNLHIFNTHISLDRTMISQNKDSEILNFISKLTNKNISKTQSITTEIQSEFENK